MIQENSGRFHWNHPRTVVFQKVLGPCRLEVRAHVGKLLRQGVMVTGPRLQVGGVTVTPRTCTRGALLEACSEQADARPGPQGRRSPKPVKQEPRCPHHTKSRRGFPRGLPLPRFPGRQPAPAVGSCRPPSTPRIWTQLQGQQAVLDPQHPHFCKQGCRTPCSHSQLSRKVAGERPRDEASGPGRDSPDRRASCPRVRSTTLSAPCLGLPWVVRPQAGRVNSLAAGD